MGMKSAWRRIEGYVLPFLDVILPEKARATRTRTRSLSDFQLVPTQHELLKERITTLLDYKDTAVADLVRALKYEHSGKAADLAAEALADYLREEVSALRTFSARPIMLVPMPLHVLRVRERGFNQMEKVLSKLPAEFHDGALSRISTSALLRIKQTPQQARLSRVERLKNVSDAFSVGDDPVKNAHVILIDDVTTTGATLASAAKPLRKAGAIVTLLALARA
jgi:ComF family protein